MRSTTSHNTHNTSKVRNAIKEPRAQRHERSIQWEPGLVVSQSRTQHQLQHRRKTQARHRPQHWV